MNCCNCPIRELGTDTVTADMPAPLTSKSASWKCDSVPSRFIFAQNSKLTSEVWCSSELWVQRRSCKELSLSSLVEEKGAAFLDLLQTSQEDRKHFSINCVYIFQNFLFFFFFRHSSTQSKSFQFTKVNMYLHPGDQIQTLLKAPTSFKF